MSANRLLHQRKSVLALAAAVTLFSGLSVPFTPVAHASATPLVASSMLAITPAAAASVASGAVELSPTPPNDTQAVPPNILVTFDDSGSMAYNYMGDDRPYDGGSWNGPWRCAGVVNPEATDPDDFGTRVMNGVYYNPNVIYAPPVNADGTSFPNADATLKRVPEDGIGVNRPHNRRTLDTVAGYNDNPGGDFDSTNATDLTGKKQTVFPDTGWYWNGRGNRTDWDNWVYGEYPSGSGWYSNNRWNDRPNRSSDIQSGAYPTTTADMRWTCGYGSTSPMDASRTGPDGKAYPDGGPYYYRYKSTAPAIELDSYGKPTSNGLYNLYRSSNWEAVAVPNTDITIDGKTVNQWQNFANWYAYYRTRNLMTRTSLSRVFGALGGQTKEGGYGSSIRIAWQNLNDGTYKIPTGTIISNLLDTADCAGADAIDPEDIQTPDDTARPPDCYRSAFFNWIFETPASGGTPSVDATSRAGRFFQRGGPADTSNRRTLRDPYWEAGKVAEDGTQAAGAELYCRQNFHMLVTDGLFNENSVSVESVTTLPQNNVTLPDGTTFDPTAGYNAIFQGVHSDSGGRRGSEASLSDLAFNYWATNLRPDLYDPANGKFVPPYLPDKTTGIVPTGDMSAPGVNNAHVNAEIYFNPKNDPANWPHLVQYMVGLGVSGELNYSDDTDCAQSTTSDACLLRKGAVNSRGSTGWPTPSDPSPGIAANIDDTWHAALAGRGDFFSAGNPQNLVDQLSTILTNISARNAPAITGATNTSVLVPGALAFSTGYSSSDWTGVMQAVGVNPDGTLSTSALWDSGAILDNAAATPPGSRAIYTAREADDGSFAGGLAFKTFTDLDPAAQALLGGKPEQAAPDDTGQSRLDYLRGDRSKEDTVFRPRAHLLGAIIGSQALYVAYPSSGYRNTWPAGSPEQTAVENDTATCGTTTPSTCHSYEYFIKDHLDRTPAVYVGANDGMLHAFDASEFEDTSTDPPVIKPTSTAGKELFAYVPRSVYANLGGLTSKSDFHFMPTVDGALVTRDVFFASDTTTPVSTKAGWHTLLVGALRLGGRGVYAIDITDPTAMGAGKVLWEFNADQPDQASWNDGTHNNPDRKSVV